MLNDGATIVTNAFMMDGSKIKNNDNAVNNGINDNGNAKWRQ